MMRRQIFNWRQFALLSAAGVVGVVAIIPYSLTLQAPKPEELSVPLEVLIPIQIAQNTVLIAIVVALGLLIAKRAGLGAPLIEGWLNGEKMRQDLKAIIAPSVIVGTMLALIVIVLDVVVFAPRVPESLAQIPQAPPWQGFLASFYGGITEELFMRLGLFSFFAWLLGKISHNSQGFPSSMALWIANILVAVIFGLGHLPAMAALVPLTGVVVIRAVALNGLAGLAFGYLYWTRGLESAVLAHFSADIMMHVVVPLFNI